MRDAWCCGKEDLRGALLEDKEVAVAQDGNCNLDAVLVLGHEATSVGILLEG